MKLRIIILVFALIVMPMFVQTLAAQPPPPDPIDIPVDGGLGFLLIAGMVFGAKKIYENRENDEFAT